MKKLFSVTTLGLCVVTAVSLPLTHLAKAVEATKSSSRAFNHFGNASSGLFDAKVLLTEHPMQVAQASSLEQKYLQEAKDDPSPSKPPAPEQPGPTKPKASDY